ncbi:MAG TPA: YkgJ family cysteine cluster protein [Candidatus Binataceae bacterium]|nr:YkgJ family cysteine cluster protein [Candidatus Binataceae bacterium]
MDRASRFSYQCNQCGLCCRNKVITLSPYDVLKIARAAGISTGEAVKRYTIRRGSILRFDKSGACVTLEGAQCTIHSGRPLACRLYPLGIERDEHGERLVRLRPEPSSLGIYSDSGTAGDFIDAQGTRPYLDALDQYRELVAELRARVAAMVDFERIEPREFWRRAVAEALMEMNYDPNPLIDAIFDPGSLGSSRNDEQATITAHIDRLREMAAKETDPDRIAAAAVMLAVSVGFSPGEVISRS